MKQITEDLKQKIYDSKAGLKKCKWNEIYDTEEKHYKERVVMYNNISNSNENIEVIECYL